MSFSEFVLQSLFPNLQEIFVAISALSQEGPQDALEVLTAALVG